MSLSNELTDLFDSLLVGCVQLSNFHGLSAEAGRRLHLQSHIPEGALLSLRRFLEQDQDPTLAFQLEDTGEVLELSRDEAAYLDRLTRMGLEIEVNYPRIANNMMLIYLTALFEAFVADSARAVILSVVDEIRQVPERRAISDNVKKLMVRLVKRQADDLAFHSIQVKLRFMERTLGVRLQGCPDTPANLDEIYATRNVLVHNGGVVNQKYLSQVRKSPLSLGDRREIDDIYLERAIRTVETIGQHLYQGLLSRYTGGTYEDRLQRAEQLTARLTSMVNDGDPLQAH